MSGLGQGKQFDVAAATSGKGDSGVAHGDVLVELVEAAMAPGDGGATRLVAARAAVIEAMGLEALVEAAAVVATFNQMVRIADATGIALDARLDIATQGLREEIGVTGFASAANTPVSGAVRRIFGRALDRLTKPIQPALLRAMTRRNRSSGPS